MAEKMTLSLLRARIRAGEYQDDRFSTEGNRLLFLCRLIQQGYFNEWDVEDAAQQEMKPTPPAPDGTVVPH